MVVVGGVAKTASREIREVFPFIAAERSVVIPGVGIFAVLEGATGVAGAGGGATGFKRMVEEVPMAGSGVPPAGDWMTIGLIPGMAGADAGAFAGATGAVVAAGAGVSGAEPAGA